MVGTGGWGGTGDSGQEPTVGLSTSHNANATAITQAWRLQGLSATECWKVKLSAHYQGLKVAVRNSVQPHALNQLATYPRP